MTRVATYASNNLLLSYLSETNRRLQNEQIQLTTGKKSQIYSGIATESQRLVAFENTYSSLDRFITNNDTADMRLNITTTAVDAMRGTVADFEEELQRYQSSAVKDRAAASQLQNSAFRSMVSMTNYLNTEADGRFVFAGGRVDMPPAELPFSTLAQFQTTYNGATITYPTTRDAHLADFSIAKDGNDQTNWLSFQQDNLATPPRGRITATTAQFANVAVGSKITISGTASNNGTYTVAAVGNGGKQIDVVTEMLTNEGPVGISISYPDPNTTNTTLSLTGSATFARTAGGDDTITYTGGAFAAIPAGSVLTVAGSASNNGTYTVQSNTGGVITIATKKLTDEGAAIYYRNVSASSFTFTNNVAAATDTIAGPAGTFSGLAAGMKVVLTGTAGGFDGTYTVNAVAANGSSITVDENLPAATATEATAAITFKSQAAPYFNFTSLAGDITFTNNTAPTKDTITTVAGSFSTLKPGMKVVLTGGAGTNGDNDTYTVDSVSTDGKTITIREGLPAATVTDANAINFLVPQIPGTIAANPYYNGDKMDLSHRPSTTREIDWNLNAASAVFEKAFRAMGLIAQGAFQSEGGLDQNGQRISQALYLVRSSLYVTAQGSPPFGAEQAGSMEATQEDLGFKQVLLKETNNFHTKYRAYLENNMARIENADKNEVITHILDDTRVLEASYQTLARIRQLSLVNFLS